MQKYQLVIIISACLIVSGIIVYFIIDNEENQNYGELNYDNYMYEEPSNSGQLLSEFNFTYSQNVKIYKPENGSAQSGIIYVEVGCLPCQCRGRTKLFIDGEFHSNGTLVDMESLDDHYFIHKINADNFIIGFLSNDIIILFFIKC